MTNNHEQRYERFSDLLLRLAISFSFAYAAIGGFINPENWVGYFPTFLSDYIPEATLLLVWGILELVLASWILFGKKIFIPAVIAGASLLGVVVFNWVSRDVVFRDISIALAAFALAIRYIDRRRLRR